MALIPWRPSGELSALQREMNRLFEQFFGELPGLDMASRGWMPRLEMTDNRTPTRRLGEAFCRCTLPPWGGSAQAVARGGRSHACMAQRSTDVVVVGDTDLARSQLCV